jgi:hypothetical protein
MTKSIVSILAHSRFFEALLLYNIILFVIFVAIYHLIDFRRHFDLPEHTPPTTHSILYYTFMTQAQVMAGEISPKTNLGRQLLVVHVFLSWFVTVALLGMSLGTVQVSK